MKRGSILWVPLAVFAIFLARGRCGLCCRRRSATSRRR